MTLRSDQKALLFMGAVAILGAGVRVVRAASDHDTSAQPALERQSQAADSAAQAGKANKQGRGSRQGRGRGRGAKRDSVAGPSAARVHQGSGALDRPGYVAGKLDLDVAT